MFRLISTIAIIQLAAASLFLQAPVPKETGTCSFSEIYKAEGWMIPGLMNAKVKKKANITDLPGVTLIVLEPVEDETTITSIQCARYNPGRLQIDESSPIRILELWAFDYKGRVFAYRVNYELQFYHEGARRALGGAISLFFYDMDGSGKFTVLKGASRLLPELPPYLAKETEPAPPTAKPIIH